MSAGLLIFVAFIYVGVAVSDFTAGHTGMGIAFAAYALANLGLAMETWR